MCVCVCAARSPGIWDRCAATRQQPNSACPQPPRGESGGRAPAGWWWQSPWAHPPYPSGVLPPGANLLFVRAEVAAKGRKSTGSAFGGLLPSKRVSRKVLQSWFAGDSAPHQVLESIVADLGRLQLVTSRIAMSSAENPSVVLE